MLAEAAFKAVYHFEAKPRNHRLQSMAYIIYKAKLDYAKNLFQR